jgi:hypothetical protein
MGSAGGVAERMTSSARLHLWLQACAPQGREGVARAGERQAVTRQLQLARGKESVAGVELGRTELLRGWAEVV